MSLPQLAQAVFDLAVRMQDAGRTASAAANAREALRLYQELSARDAEGRADQGADRHSGSDADRYADALRRCRECLEFLAGAAGSPSPSSASGAAGTST